MLQWLDLSKLLSRGMSANVGSLPIMRKKLLMSYLSLCRFCIEQVYAAVWQNYVHKKKSNKSSFAVYCVVEVKVSQTPF